ncbi:MAG: beta-glucosidase [Hyphomonadaceae bacterium]|nr:MAG: beta-glucosidase [Hyphomonadaceae bacterium]
MTRLMASNDQQSRRDLLKGAVSSIVIFGAASNYRPALAAPRDRQIENLISRMTIQEKAGQLSIFSDSTRIPTGPINPNATPTTTDDIKNQIRSGKITALFSARGAAGAREYQRISLEETRMKIPMVFAADIIHGCITQFPIPLGEAASFDTDLAMRTAAAAAFESTATAIHWTFAPMVDVARDQRWGRVAEGAGEDTYLGEQMAKARVKGFQGDNLKSETTVLACAKHFAAYGAVQGGMDYNTADIPETTLRQVHLPPFKAAFDAGALSTMSSFNDIAGVPSTGNHHLLTDILRGEWAFKGLVVSDYTSEAEMINHGFAKDGRDATKKSIMAGCDMSMQSGLYWDHLPDLVAKGEVLMRVVDEAVRRVLGVKKALGLFENPYRSMSVEREVQDMRKPENIALAREAARKSVVLIKNEGDILPLKKSGQKIALIGPLGDDKTQTLGCWAIFPDFDNAVTLAQGLGSQIVDRANLKVVKGCEVNAAIEGGIASAMAAAQAADVVILAVGETQDMSGEAQSRVEITIPKAQQDLADAIAATGKPIVVVLTHGRALELQGAIKNAQAIMAAWFLGSESGNGLADLIFGDFSPSARLPVSFPLRSGQQPLYYNHRRTGRPQTTTNGTEYRTRYREAAFEALYSFGHGLTYSKIEYGPTQISGPQMPMNGQIAVTATIKNSGIRQAREVVQFYVHDKVASITQPVRLLKDFKLVDLAAGETKTIEFILTKQDLAFVRANLRHEAEAGEFDVWIAPSSVGGVAAKVVLTA